MCHNLVNKSENDVLLLAKPVGTILLCIHHKIFYSSQVSCELNIALQEWVIGMKISGLQYPLHLPVVQRK